MHLLEDYKYKPPLGKMTSTHSAKNNLKVLISNVFII